jgi:aspartyl-tRNA(Asn)/glutamyl-tRNA(Gln) amidotransferase subunit A
VENPVASVEARLARIAKLDLQLRAFVSLDADGALRAAGESARRRARGQALSPIDGMPMAVKANIAVAGWPFHAGIAAYRNRVATSDAACVARLRAGGAVLLGLLNMDEGALGDTTDNPRFGRTENPLRAGFTAGGSSGGAGAAVAAGFCDAALGTDTLGSVRIPAAYCGIIGHKPPHGAISTDGVVPLAPPYDTVGILAHSVAAAEAVRRWLGAGEAVAGPLAGPIGVFVSDGIDVGAHVAEALAETAEKARRIGYELQPVTIPHSCRDIAKAALLAVELEAAAVHDAERARNPAGFSKGFLKALDWAGSQSPAHCEAARFLLAQAAADIRHAFAPYAAVLMPTTPQAAFAFGHARPRNTADFTSLANVAGLAATAFPAGVDADGMPVSVQAVGANESACLRLAGEIRFPIEQNYKAKEALLF